MWGPPQVLFKFLDFMYLRFAEISTAFADTEELPTWIKDKDKL
uniref:Uncharacterized protein n=1 Tax=Rhizophora mucronata TaxID=61149 RepID=A0A2P2M2Z3_RHIMU